MSYEDGNVKKFDTNNKTYDDSYLVTKSTDDQNSDQDEHINRTNNSYNIFAKHLKNKPKFKNHNGYFTPKDVYKINHVNNNQYNNESLPLNDSRDNFVSKYHSVQYSENIVKNPDEHGDVFWKSNYKKITTFIGYTCILTFLIALVFILKYINEQEYNERLRSIDKDTDKVSIVNNTESYNYIGTQVYQKTIPILDDKMSSSWRSNIIYKTEFATFWSIHRKPLKLYYCNEDKIYSIDVISGKTSMMAGGGNSSLFSSFINSTELKLIGPFSLIFDKNDNIYFLESEGKYIRKLDTRSLFISTFFTQEEQIDEDKLKPQKITIDSYTDKIYLVYKNFIRLIETTTGNETKLVAGVPGGVGSSGDDGPASYALFGLISTIAFDIHSNIYVSDILYHNIRMISSKTGIISRIAGVPCKLDSLGYPIMSASRYSGDGGKALDAQLNRPSTIVIDSFNNIYFADSKNYRIRKISSDGIISTILGNGKFETSGEDYNKSQSLCATQESFLTSYFDANAKVLHIYLRMFCYLSSFDLDYLILDVFS